MGDEVLFRREQAEIEAAAGALDAPGAADSPLHAPFARLLASYEKLMRRTARLVKISDLQQHELRELSELKSRFVGMAAHDLRNPCTSLRGFSEMLLEMEDLDENLKTEFLRSINRVSAEMLALLNDLLDVTMIETGRLVLAPKQADLAALAGERIHLMTPAAARKGMRINAETPDGPAEASFDPDRIAQVVDNLLSNAVKYAPTDSVVTVAVRNDGDEVALSVRDRGPGIAEGDLDKLFGTFQKLGAKPTGGEKSTGLGLAIVKRIVDAHHGRIHVDNIPGGGCTFEVTLPRQRGDDT